MIRLKTTKQAPRKLTSTDLVTVKGGGLVSIPIGSVTEPRLGYKFAPEM
jgi:hypothetical protein